MTIDENGGNMRGEKDNFPVGMRVLAVDDDPTCLMLLDGLLRKCQYHVTTTNHAQSALKMVREDRNRFDLIISDVHMPDMDGFKLLELVGLEMDLPVIMLSAYGDPKLVMKGITHGACDYLLKPVRIEELRNIWQHVIRKKKYEPKSQNNSLTQDKDDQQGGEGGQGKTMAGDTDENDKVNRKRKEEEEEGDDSGYDNDDPSAQKRPRVVWSIELHRKFVAAVNQLGLEKAFPKRILDLMNVEGITRENVASHLQKYRSYLKRISTVASQQASMVAAFGGKDSSYIHMGSFNGFGDLRSGYGDLRSFSGLGTLPNAPLSSYQPSGMLGRFNSLSNVNLHSSSSSLIQTNHIQNPLINMGPAQTLSDSSNGLGKFQPVVLPTNENSSLFQRIPTPLELDQTKCANRIRESYTTDDLRVFTPLSTLTESTITAGSSNNSLTNGLSNPLFIQGDPHISSLKVDMSGAHLLDHGRCNENWQNTFQSSNHLPLTDSFTPQQLPLNSTGYNISSTRSHNQSSPIDFSSNNTMFAQDSRAECQEGLVGNTVLNMSQTPNQWCTRDTHDCIQSSNIGFGNVHSVVTSNCVMDSMNKSMQRSIGIASNLVQHHGIENSTMGSKFKSNEGYFLEPTKAQSGFIPPQSYDSLDDLMSAVTKRKQDGAMSTDGEFGFDANNFGSCI